MLSVVIPSFNESGLIFPAAGRLGAVLSSAAIPYELIFVDDGSRDATWQEIREVCQGNSRIRGIRFSRNFGKEAAIFAGLAQAKGACCAVIDCDLQHPPEKLVEMYRLWQQGWEVVNGVKADRGRESTAHGLAARCFYGIMSRAARVDMHRSSDFKLLDRKVVDALLALPERRTFFRGLVGWMGYRAVDVEYSVAERSAGNTHFSTAALFRYAMSNIVSFSAAPMQIVTVLGGLFLLASVILGIQTLVRWASGTAADGFTTVILLLLFTGSILMIALGLIGYYIAQIFLECKGRPRYLIMETQEREEHTTDAT